MVKDFVEGPYGVSPRTLAAGIKGTVKEVRPIAPEFQQYHPGETAILRVAWKGHGTSYNVPAKYVKKLSRAKPRLSR